ncbi:MAG: fibronectin type III domain-containing protein [Acidiferrobacterales bacterium]
MTVTVQAVNGTADLSWIPPTTNEDGSPVSLTGFNVYQGSSATSLSKIATVGATTTTYKVSNLPAGTHYFAVTAVGGGESQFSNVASKTIF